MGEGREEVPYLEKSRFRPSGGGRRQAVKVWAKDHNVLVGREWLQGLEFLRPSQWVGLGAGAPGKQASLWNSQFCCCLSH